MNGFPSVDPRFAERISRIEAQRQRSAPATKPRARWRESGFAYVLSLVAAFFVGVLVVFAARYARFQLTGVTPGSTTLNTSNLAVDMVLAFMVGFLLQQIFNFRRPEHTGAKTLGMIVAVLTMHMAVHAFPGVFSVIFSETWVHQVIRLTDPTKIAIF